MALSVGRMSLALCIALSAAACSEVDTQERPQSDVEVRTGEGRHAVLYRFEGRFNTTDLTMDLRLLPAETVSSSVPKASYCEVLVVQDGVPGSGPTDSLELYTPPGTIFRDEDCFGGAYPSPSPIINSYYQSARAFCGGVAIRSFFDTETLQSVYAVIDEVLPASGHFGYQYPLGTGAEAPTDGDQAPSAARGLWAYGDIAPGGESVQNWIFERRTEVEEITLNGTIVAYYDEICGDGIDNDCDGEADEGCILGQFGDPCTLDTECTTGVCTANACAAPRCSNFSQDGTETDVDCGGGACDPCAVALGCNVNGDCLSNVCSGGVCVPDPVPAPGEVVITEVFGAAGAGYSYVELYNRSGSARFLGSCTLENQLGQNFVVPGASLAAGSFGVIVDDASAGGVAGFPNVLGGWASQATFDTSRTNATYTLACDGVTVAELTLTTPQVTGLVDSYTGLATAPENGSIQVHTTAVDDVNWGAASNICLSPDSAEIGGTGFRGTPGAANASCDTAAPPWCRLQWPVETIEIPAGGTVEYYGRTYIAGLTDQGPTNEYYPRLMGQVGYGDDGTDPAADGSWVWNDAAPYALWTPFASAGEAYENEVNNNEYVATVTAPNSPGTTFDVAYRFSGDGGATWTYCDRNAGAGSDGAQDSYQVANAGGFSVIAPVATPDSPGDLFFTEFMPQPSGGDVAGEWFELYNASGAELQLQGCSIEQNGGASFTINTSLIAQPDEYLVFARSREPAENGGLPNVDYVYDAFALRSISEQLVLSCPSGGGDFTVDVAGYGGSVGEGVSMQLKNARFDADGNDVDADYCKTFNATYGGDGRRGTPGAANPDCVPLSFCRLQFPGSHTGAAATTFDVFARVYASGLTDVSGVNTPDPSLVLQVGVGPDGTQPDDSWSWTPMQSNASYNAGSSGYEPNNDEYQGSLEIPDSATSLDYAVRASNDGGASWSLYCDTGNGSSDGYAPADAGQLTVTAARRIDFCNATASVAGPVAHYTGERFGLLSSVYVAGFTDDPANFPAAGILEAEFGLGPAGTDPAVNDAGWTWVPPVNNRARVIDGNNFVFLRVQTMPAVSGTARRAVSRVRIDGGAWVYCDEDGYDATGALPYDAASLLVLDPLPIPADWFNMQFPNYTVTVPAGQNMGPYAQLYIAGRSTAFGSMRGTDDPSYNGAFTNAELRFGYAYGPVNSDPAAGGWTRVNGVPNTFWNFLSNNDEYQTTVAIPTPGTYSVATFFSGDGGVTYQYRFNQAGSTNPLDAYQVIVTP